MGHFTRVALLMTVLGIATLARGANDWTSGEALYNLGIEQFRAGQIGESMASMLAARRELPRDPEVAANLAVIGARISDKLVPAMPRPVWGMLVFWVYDLVPRELLWGGGILWAMGFGVLVSRRRFEGQATALGAMAFVLIGLGAVTLASVPVASAVQRPWGAVVVAEAPVRASPEGTVEVFVLREGAPFEVVGARPGWYSIRLSDGKSGWLPAGSARVR